ncbi:hypothetical protein TNCV_2924501 [Trichonephila clavipes]|nr:hypothetical protein TNCV_2924501 [Trichonephila clavipes]
MTFAAAWTLSTKTMTAAILDAASTAGVSSMLWSTMNLDVRMARRHFLIIICESMFSLHHQDNQIPVWWHRGEPTLTASIRHRHTG